MFGKENRRGVGNTAQTAVGHRKDAEFVHSPEAVFKGAHEAEIGMGVAFKVKDRVNDVFQNAGAGEGTLLGDVPHKKEGGAGGFGKACEPSRAFAHLRDAPRGAVQFNGKKRLNGVDDDKFGFKPQ